MSLQARDRCAPQYPHRIHGRMLHLGIGRAHARTEIICLIHNNDAAITTHDGTVLAEYVLDPTRDYQRKNG